MSYTESNLKRKTLAELREICSGLGVSGAGTKQIIISNILNGNSGAPVLSGPCGQINTMSNSLGTGTAFVSSGASSGEFSVVGLPIYKVKQQLREALNIDPSSQAVLNGSTENETEVVHEGDTLEFIKKAGTKG